MTQLTEAQKEAYARAHTSSVDICCVELRHPSFVSAQRICQGGDDIQFTLEANAPEDPNTLVTFTGVELQIKDPEVTTEADTTLQVVVPGASALVLPFLGEATKA